MLESSTGSNTGSSPYSGLLYCPKDLLHVSIWTSWGDEDPIRLGQYFLVYLVGSNPMEIYFYTQLIGGVFDCLPVATRGSRLASNSPSIAILAISCSSAER